MRLPFTYQWYKNGSAIPGATDAILAIPSTAVTDSGLYAVAVSNAFGSGTSYTVQLSVIQPPTVVTPPVGGTVMAGANETFTVGTLGANNLSYQWYHDGAAVPGATSSTLTLTGVAPSDSGLYAVALADGNGHIQTSTLGWVAAGVYTSFYVRPDGSMWATGFNDAGQLGDGLLTNQATAVQVAGDVVKVSASYHTLYLKHDSTLWAMGHNGYGQIPDGSTTDRPNPEQVASGVATMAAGLNHTLYITTDGSLWASGLNTSGQLGDGSTTNRSTAVPVATGAASVSAGAAHTLFVKADGTLWAMGSNSNGQLGDGTVTERNSPVQVASGVLAVAAGATHSVFLKTDETLWAMGLNGNGQLGDGTIQDRHTPVKLASGVVSVSARGRQTFFIKTDGSLWATGLNSSGQLGNGTITERHTPVQVASGVVQVASGPTHTLFEKSDGTLWVVGDNIDGQLGDGTTVQQTTPEQLASGLGVGARVIVNLPVSITTQPSDQTVVAGNPATFTVAAAGTAPFTYQWAVGGVAISGATSATYTIAATQLSDAGSYSVTVTNAAGSLASGAAVLTVQTVPVITTQPSSQTVTVLNPVTFTAAATGTPTPTWQWYKDSVAISGATSATYSITNALGADAGTYTATATNAAGSATTNGAVLTVNLLSQSITFGTLADRGFTGGPITLSASASSTLPVSFSIVSNNGNATINGTLLTLTGLGQVTVRASQLGSSTYAAATPVDQSFNVTADYAYWTTLHFSGAEVSAGTVTADTYTYGADHLSNLLKYALGLDPKQNATSGLPAVSIANGNWTYTYTRPTSMPDLTYAVEASTDLVNWSTTNVTHSLVSSSNGTDTWHATYPVASAANVFFRLKVTRQ